MRAPNRRGLRHGSHAGFRRLKMTGIANAGLFDRGQLQYVACDDRAQCQGTDEFAAKD